MKIGDEMEIKEEKKAIKNLKASYMEDWGLAEDQKDDLDALVYRVLMVGKEEGKQQATPEGFVFNDVFAERKRQIDQEHYSHEHDDEYDKNELIRAASSYLSHVIGRRWVFKETCPETYQDEEAPDLWPWDLDLWKPKNPRRDLVRAAALIIAEIEKIDRSTGAKS